MTNTASATHEATGTAIQYRVWDGALNAGLQWKELSNTRFGTLRRRLRYEVAWDTRTHPLFQNLHLNAFWDSAGKK